MAKNSPLSVKAPELNSSLKLGTKKGNSCESKDSLNILKYSNSLCQSLTWTSGGK